MSFASMLTMIPGFLIMASAGQGSGPTCWEGRGYIAKKVSEYTGVQSTAVAVGAYLEGGG